MSNSTSNRRGNLRQCNVSRTLLVFGGSSVSGAGTGTSPYTKPPNCTYHRFNGTVVDYNRADWPNNYGISVGIAEALRNERPYTLFEYGVSGSSWDTWWVNFVPPVITGLDSQSLIPACAVSYMGASDALVLQTSATVTGNIQLVLERLRTEYGAGMGVIINGVQPVDRPYRDIVIEGMKAWVAADVGKAIYVSNDDLILQDDLLHPTGPEIIRAGLTCGRILASSGVLRDS